MVINENIDIKPLIKRMYKGDKSNEIIVLPELEEKDGWVRTGITSVGVFPIGGHWELVYRKVT